MVTQARCTFCGPRPALSHPSGAVGREIASEAWISGHGGCLSKRQYSPKVGKPGASISLANSIVSWGRVIEGRCASGRDKVSASRWGSGDEIFTNGRVKVWSLISSGTCVRGGGGSQLLVGDRRLGGRRRR